MNLDINHKKETDWLLQIQVDNKMGPCPQGLMIQKPSCKIRVLSVFFSRKQSSQGKVITILNTCKRSSTISMSKAQQFWQIRLTTIS